MKTLYFIIYPLTFILLVSCSGNSADNLSLKALTASEGKTTIFHRRSEPNENAFTFLLPDGWNLSGGISRVDPNSSGGAGNAIEAKLYMKISSPNGKAEMGWLPDTRFFDMHRFPGANPAADMFPDGSTYNGMQVMSLPTPEEFILKVAIPFAHPHADGIRVVNVSPLPELAEEFSNLSTKMIQGYRFSYEAAIVSMEFYQNGSACYEKMICVIEDYGKAGGGLWGNKETWYIRADKKDFKSLAPVFATVGQSVKLNPEWIRKEIRSQQQNSNIALQTQQSVEKIDREITQHRARTNAEINNDMYLDLTGQEDFTNPFTGETERGSNDWNYRWENEKGDVIYHNSLNYNPNEDKDLIAKGFKRSEIRKR